MREVAGESFKLSEVSCRGAFLFGDILGGLAFRKTGSRSGVELFNGSKRKEPGSPY